MTLQTLIAILEEEKASLLHLIDNAVKEENFQLASYNLKSIRHLDRQLHTLRTLEDPMFVEKKDIQETIERMKMLVESDKSGTYRDFYTKQIDSYYKELQALNDTAPVTRSGTIQLVLDDCFNQLVEQKIRAFKLVLSRSENLIFEIRGINEFVRITIPDSKALLNNNLLSGKKIDKLLRLGFQWVSNGDHLFLDIRGNKNEIEDRFRLLVMHLVFEVFHFMDFHGQAYIEI